MKPSSARNQHQKCKVGVPKYVSWFKARLSDGFMIYYGTVDVVEYGNVWNIMGIPTS
jgi:hypothetical protein